MQSDANKKSKQHKEWIYFVDRSLPKVSLIQALRQRGCKVKHHDELFSAQTKDIDWLQEAGKNGWIVLSHDRNIGRNPLEINQLRLSKVMAFMPSSKGSLTGKEITEIIVNAISCIEQFAKNNNPPFIAKIYRDGSIKRWR